MSVLVYNDVRMQIMRTEILRFDPVRSEDGSCTNYTEFEIAVRAMVNPQAMASAGPGVQAREAQPSAPFQEDAPKPGPPGDPLGTSIANLKQMLMQDRAQLVYSINGNEVVRSPAFNPERKATAPVDARFGPIVKECKVLEIHGVKSAVIFFRVVTWLVDFVPGGAATENIVLSNRYTVSCSYDREYWSTRHVSGQMVVNTDQLNTAGLLTPDAFRQAAFLQIPRGFKRQNCEVLVSSDNTTLDYSYEDVETPLALGFRSQATHVEANATAGVESPIKDLFAVARGARKAADAGLALGMGLIDPWGLLGGHGAHGAADAAGDLAASIMPRLLANGIVRVWGQRNANKADLAALATNILIDRFQVPGGGGLGGGVFMVPGRPPRFVSFFVTQDLTERFIEVRAEFFSPPNVQLSALVNTPNVMVGQMMNFSTDVKSGAAAGTDNPLKGDGTGNNPPPPNGGGTRGNYLGALVASFLTTPGQLPQSLDPPPNVNDQANFD